MAGRFGSVAMDEAHTLAAFRYVALNPVLQRTDDFRTFLAEKFDEAATYAPLRKAETIGHPIGSAA